MLMRKRQLLILCILLGLILFASSPNSRIVHASTTVTFQPSTADTYLQQDNPDVNYGSSTNLDVRSNTGGGNHRTILKFDVSSVIPNGATVISATLSLRYYGYGGSNDPSGRIYNVYRLTQTAWTELGSTWNNYTATQHWTISGGDYSTTDGASASVPSSFGWMNWAVTAQVQYAVNNVGGVAHLLIRDQGEDSATDYHASFYSKEWTTDADRPKLEVTYAVIDRIAFTTGPQILTAGTASGAITIQTQDATGAVNVPSDTTITLSSTSGAGRFSLLTSPWIDITSVTITAGSDSASFYYNDTTAGTPTITAAESPSEGWTDATQQETVNAANLDHFTFATIISPQTAGAAFSITITGKDAYENTVTSYVGTNILSDTTGTINPTSTTAFSSGVWSGSVTISKSQTGVSITTTGATKTGTSNNFNVNPTSSSVQSATGTGLVVFSPDAGVIEGLAAVSESTLPSAGKPNLAFPHGFFSFTITGLTAGATVTVTITFPSPMPVGTQYWKYGPTPGNLVDHWYQIPIGDDDGDNVITITVTDNGLGDDILTGTDLQIVDQGGPGTFTPAAPVGPVGGVLMAVNKLAVLVPYLALAGLVAAASSLYALRKRCRS
jgi:hypothetical protein